MNYDSSPAWSLKGRHESSPNASSPGPGAYSTANKTFEELPRYSISRANRFTDRSETTFLGPGAYQPTTLLSVQGGVIERSLRKSLELISESPGPGAYNSTNSPSGPAFSIVGRESLKERTKEIPGPGSYNLKPPELSNGCVFGQTKKDTTLVDRSKTPGPGTYVVHSGLLKSGVKFATGKTITRYNKSPGPGMYKIPTTLSQIGYSIKGKTPRKPLELSPGPGRYELPTMSEKRSYSLGKTKRLVGKYSPIPGPGSYEIVDVKQNSAKAVFGSSPKFLQHRMTKNKSPGPGAYDTKEVESAKGFSLTGKGKSPHKQAGPGPGTYNPVPTISTSPKSIIGKSKRLGLELKNDVPGPGSYLITSDDGKGIKFGSSKRNAIADNQIPGPGKYNIKSTISNLPNYAK